MFTIFSQVISVLTNILPSYYKKRSCQEECYEAVLNTIEEGYDNKCLVKMFCGTGKSMCMTFISAGMNADLTVYVVPRLALVSQFSEDYLYKYFPQSSLLQICSDADGVNNNTTTSRDIQKFLKKKGSKIVVVTYQSFDVLLDNLGDKNIDLCHFDEAHNAVGEKNQKLCFENKDRVHKIDFSVYWTATPRDCNGISMTGGDCGEIVYEYSYTDGLNDDILSPFDTRLDFFTENTNTSIYETIARTILISGNSRVLTYHSRVDESHGSTSVKAFVSKAKFVSALNKVIDEEFPEKKGFYKKINVKGIYASTKNRETILQQLEKTKQDEIYIVSSCDTISEGIDTKNANMVVFVDSKNSVKDIIQNIGRVCRKVQGIDSTSTVLLPCWVNKENYKDSETAEDCDKVIREGLTETGDFSSILNVCAALKQEDPEQFELCVRYPRMYKKEEVKKDFEKSGYKIDESLEEKTLEACLENTVGVGCEDMGELEDFVNEVDMRIEIHTQDMETPVEYYGPENDEEEDCSNVIRIFRNEDGEFFPIVEKEKRKNNPGLGSIGRKKAGKLDIHTNDDVKILWRVEGDLNMNEKITNHVIKATITWGEKLVEQWRENRDKVEAFFEEEGRKPSQQSKDPAEKSSGVWISNQNKNYKKEKEAMKNPVLRQEWEDFVGKWPQYLSLLSIEEQRIEKWRKSRDKAEEYFEEGRKPSMHSKDPAEKTSGLWISHQVTNYKNQKKGMKNPMMRKEWEEFVGKWPEYFLSTEEKWRESRDKIEKKYFEKGRKPSECSKDSEEATLGRWISSQSQNYKNQQHNMKISALRQEWEEFVSKWPDYLSLLSGEELRIEQWRENRDKVEEYFEQKRRRPNKKSEDLEEKKLGLWLNTQKVNYKKQKNSMEIPILRQEWEEFVGKWPDYLSLLSGEELRIEQWRENRDKAEEYFKKGMKPSISSEIPEEKRLGLWLSQQDINYRNDKYTMKISALRQEWKEFVGKWPDYLSLLSGEELRIEQWRENRDKVEKFFQREGGRKLNRNSVCLQEKTLGKWISTQNQNYKNRKQIMENLIIRKEWEDLVSSWSQYLSLLSDEEQRIEEWRKNRDKVEEYFEKGIKPTRYKRDPEEKKLGEWIASQDKNYKKQKYSMGIPALRKEWEDLIEKYPQHFPNHEYIPLEISPKKSPKKSETSVSPENYTSEYLSTLTITKLKDIAKTLVVKRYTKYKTSDKDKLIEEILIKVQENKEENKEELTKEEKRQEDLLKMTVPELKKICKERSLKVKGKKSELVQRILESDGKTTEITQEKTPENDEVSNCSDDTEKDNEIFEFVIDEDEISDEPPSTSKPQQTMQAPTITKNKTPSGKGWNNSVISSIHRTWNNTLSKNKHTHFRKNPQDWHTYHDEHKKMEESFPEDQIPRNIITKYLNKIKTRHTKKVLDMGCGRINISSSFRDDKRFDFTNYDLISGVENITECDICNLPDENDSVDICVMSLSMLGKNSSDYIKEAHRVLETNGILYLSEPAKRWTDTCVGDNLKKIIENVGFSITSKKEDKFLVYTCVKQ